MELGYCVPMLILLVVVLSISLYSLKLFIYKARSTVGGKLPPGSFGWPIVGEGFDFMRAGREGAPEKFFYDRIKKYSSEIFTTSLVGEAITVMCGAAGNKFLFSNERKLVTPWFPPAFLKLFSSTSKKSPDKDESKMFRKLSRKLLNVGLCDTMARKHFENYWDHKNEVTVYTLAKNYTFSLTCWMVLRINDKALLHELTKQFLMVSKGLATAPIDLPGTTFNRAKKASKWIHSVLLSIVKQRMIDLSSSNSEKAEAASSQMEDFLSELILYTDDEHDNKLMNEMEITEHILGLLLGAHEPPTIALTAIMKFLAEFPEVYNEVRREQIEIAKSKAPGELLTLDDTQKMRYSWSVACEAMRLATSAPGAFRQALTDFTYEGYFIPKGSKLYWSGVSTHRNPEYFPEPEKFKPSRFEGKGPAPFTFIPFGGGPRMCPGKEYARVEILVFMHHVVRRYKWEKMLPNDDKLLYNPMPLPAEGLPILLQPHPHD